MASSLMKTRIFGRAALLFVVIALTDATAEEVEMTHITLKPLPITAVTTAHRVAFVGDTPRLILGAMAEDDVALELFEVQGHTTSPLATIGLLLPARVDFDLAANPRGGLYVAYEAYGGAVSTVRIQPVGTSYTPKLPSHKTIVNESRPRFVRGGGMAVVVSEDGSSAAYLEIDTTPHRMELCTCLDAIAVTTSNGLAVVAKTLRPGASIANVLPGGLTLAWPRSGGVRLHTLFGGKDVFDYDAVASSSAILVAAVLETGLTVTEISADGVEKLIPVDGLPADLELLSPVLSTGDGTLTLATLAMISSRFDAPSTLFYGVLQP